MTLGSGSASSRWIFTVVFLVLLALPAAAVMPAPPVTPSETALTDTTPTDTTLTDPAPVEPLEPEPFEEAVPTDTASTTTYFEEDDDGIGEEGGAAVCAGCMAAGVALPLILLGISIAIAFWIYRDAKERNIPSAPLWAILGFLFSVLGLIIYLVARNNLTPPSSGAVPPAAPPPPPPV